MAARKPKPAPTALAVKHGTTWTVELRHGMVWTRVNAIFDTKADAERFAARLDLDGLKGHAPTEARVREREAWIVTGADDGA